MLVVLRSFKQCFRLTKNCQGQRWKLMSPIDRCYLFVVSPLDTAPRFGRTLINAAGFDKDTVFRSASGYLCASIPGGSPNKEPYDLLYTSRSHSARHATHPGRLRGVPEAGRCLVNLRLCMECGHVGCCDSSRTSMQESTFTAPITRSSGHSSRARIGAVDEIELDFA
jgi:hypothetical protein